MRIFYLILMFLFGFSFMVSMLYSIHNFERKTVLFSIFALFDLILVYVFYVLAG